MVVLKLGSSHQSQEFGVGELMFKSKGKVESFIYFSTVP